MATLSDELDLLERHVRVLLAVQDDGPIGIIRLSQRLGLRQYRVRYSLRVLEREGLLRPTEAGAESIPGRKHVDLKRRLADLSGLALRL